MSITPFDTLEEKLRSHYAIQELEIFGKNLIKYSLNEKQLAVFFATLWAFFREVPTGILSLSLRISDDWMTKYDEWDGTSQAAYILFADVDEFGLRSKNKLLPTHHQLFIKLIDALSLDRNNLLDPENIDESGKTFGQLTHNYYRNKTIPEGLGFHFASELTSSLEFQYFLDGFKAHKKTYGLDREKQAALSFFHIHTLVEPLHLELGKITARNYIEKEPYLMSAVENGAISFMAGFETLFRCFNMRLFN